MTLRSRPRVFDDIRVIEMTRFSPVSFVGMILADLGADVVKVEPTLASGVSGTAVSPPEVPTADWINRNKRSLALDYRTEAGGQVLRDLAARSDVLLEGFRPGALDKYGLGYAGLSAVNDRLVFCSLSGYGQDGPYKDVLGHDLNYLGFAGVLGLLGTADEPGVPMNLVADLGGGALFATIAVLAALHSRGRTGRGQYLDMSYVDGTLALLGATSVLKSFLTAGDPPAYGTGLHSGRYPYYTTYACRDGLGISVGCAETATWKALCAALGTPDLDSVGPVAADRTRAPQERHRMARKRLAEVFAERDRDDWFARLSTVATCVGKVSTVDEVFTDPQLRHRGMVDGRNVLSPVHVTGDGVADARRAPARGEHTDEILAWLGHADRIDEYRAGGVV